jgi:chemotaxis protein MotB
MARKRKKHEEDQEDLGRWLVSYADFITLLFAFFVTMYSISRVDEKKLDSMVESLQKALGATVIFHAAQKDPGLFTNTSQPMDIRISPRLIPKRKTPGQEEMETLALNIRKKMEELSRKGENGENLMKQVQFLIDRRGLVLRFSERFFFDSGEASIHPQVIPLLDILAQSLEQIQNQIRIEGHTDSVPIHNARFPSNWELSTARSTTIVHYLLTHFKFDPNRLSAAGYGEFRPIASNQTADGRLQNRRVDIVILCGEEMEKEPRSLKARSSTPPLPDPL